MIQSQYKGVDRDPVCDFEVFELYPQMNRKSLTDIQQQMEMIEFGH